MYRHAPSTNLHRRDTSQCEEAPAIADAVAQQTRHSPRRVPKVMPKPKTQGDAAATAKLLVVLLAFAWGLNWIAAAYALREVSPWSLRVAGSAIGAATLFGAAIFTGHNMSVPRGEYIHVMIAGFFNVAGFQILSGLCPAERGDLARHHHHLFDADLDDGAEPFRAR